MYVLDIVYSYNYITYTHALDYTFKFILLVFSSTAVLRRLLRLIMVDFQYSHPIMKDLILACKVTNYDKGLNKKIKKLKTTNITNDYQKRLTTISYWQTTNDWRKPTYD